MKIMLRSLFVLILIASAQVATAQSLWNKTEYGMSLDQVKAVVPGTISPSNPDSYGKDAKELLRLEDIEIMRRMFDAFFIFKNDKLIQVTLSLKKGEKFDSTVLFFKELVLVLRSKYGQELDHEIKPGSAKAIWMAGRTDITLKTYNLGEKKDAVLLIIYGVYVAQHADKL
jgi:hypothetical protein